MSNASNLSTLANVLDDGSDGQFLKSTGSGGVAFDTVAAGAVVYATADLLPLSGNSAGDMAYVTATNRFYINNGSGWYSVSLVNTNPNITSVQDASSGTTPFTLATDGTATVITVTAADPEDIPLTYGYSVTSGSLNGSTVAQGTGSNSNVFTVTPHASNEAIFTITFTASDGINQATSANAFSLSFVTIVTDSNHTTLLATATSTGGNVTIEDSSTANSGSGHNITVNGDAHAGTFSPYRSGGYATSFSRSGSSKLEIASMPAIGSGDCSIELWCKIDSQAWNGIISRGAYASSGTFSLSTRSGDTELTLVWNGFIYTTSGANININEWNWIQVVRSSGTITIYVNGISRKSVSNSANISSTSNYIIGRVDSSDYFGGQIRDLRISTNAQSSSNGSEKLATDSNTTFLSCHLPYLSYATSSVASNTYSSISGTIETVSSSPYDYEEYDAADHGGSVYFDGSGDSLNTTATQIIPSTSFTVTAWVYFKDTTQNAVWGQGTSGHSGRCGVSLDNGTWYAQIGNTVIGQSTSPSINEWLFTDLQWDGSTLKFFVNGSLIGSASTSNSPTNSALYIGDLGSSWTTTYPLNGYVSDLKVVSGTPSGSSTVPTAPLSSSGTSLHIKGTDASIIDKAQRYNINLDSTSIVGHSTTKWSGANSIYINSMSNNSDLITLPAGVLNASKPFTIEMWLRTNSGSASGFWSIHKDSGNTMRLKMRTDDRLEFYHIGSNAAAQEIKDETNTYLLNNTDFYHVAITRDANSVFYLHQNGIKLGNFTSNGDYDSSDTAFIIGKSQPATERYMNGYIQDFRITQGLARYTAADESANIPSAPLEG